MNAIYTYIYRCPEYEVCLFNHPTTDVNYMLWTSFSWKLYIDIKYKVDINKYNWNLKLGSPNSRKSSENAKCWPIGVFIREWKSLQANRKYITRPQTGSGLAHEAYRGIPYLYVYTGSFITFFNLDKFVVVISWNRKKFHQTTSVTNFLCHYFVFSSWPRTLLFVL